MRISDWSSDVCSSDLGQPGGPAAPIDRRLKLAACPDTPSVEGPAMGAAVIRCAPVGWRIGVPLRDGEMAAASDKAAILIKKGDQVNRMQGNARFNASTTMISDQHGAHRDLLRVTASRSYTTVVPRV